MAEFFGGRVLSRPNPRKNNVYYTREIHSGYGERGGDTLRKLFAVRRMSIIRKANEKLIASKLTAITLLHILKS